MPAIPLIIWGAQTGIGAYMSHRAQKNAEKRSAEEQAALGGAQGAGGALARMGQGLYGQGTGLARQGQQTLAQPTNYFSRLLGGNRALASQAIAGPRGAISDVYRGAERGLEQGGVRGAQRDVARGELSRQRAGQIGSLLTGVQPAAASALTAIGENQTQQGIGMAGTGMQGTSASGNLFANLLGQGSQNRRYARDEGQQAGSTWGGLIFDLLGAAGSAYGARGGGGRALLPARQTVPNMSWLPAGGTGMGG